MFNPAHPTLVFTLLALMLGLGAWTLNPIEPIPFTFVDQATFLGISCGKNVLSGLLLSVVGVFGLLGRPRFDHGLDVLVSMVGCCLGMILSGAASAWLHLMPSPLTRSVTHACLSFALINASFALIASQLPLRGRWWLLGSLQGLIASTVLYQHFYHDQRFLLMSEVFVILLMVFSLLRVWRLSASIYLLGCTLALALSWFCGVWDTQVFAVTQQIVSGHSLQQFLWAVSGGLWLKYFIQLRPRELAQLLQPSSSS